MGQILPFVPRVLRGYPTLTEALDPAESALLLGIRWWVVDLQAAADPLPRLREAMQGAGAPEAGFPLDLLMRVIAQTARRQVEIACPRCPRVTGDEQCLLHAARLAQGGADHAAGTTLGADMVSAEGAGCALAPLARIGALFRAAGLLLRPRALLAPGTPPAADGGAWLTPPA